MFRTLIKLLTATTFVVHGLLGCCWHHTHPQRLSTERAGGERGACHAHRHHQVHHSASEQATDTDDHGSPNSGAPHEPGCDEEDCVFVRAQDTVNSTADLAPALAPFLVSAQFSDVPGLAESVAQGVGAFQKTPSPSAPLHALRQVWLI